MYLLLFPVIVHCIYSKTCIKQPLKKKEDQKLPFEIYYCLMQVESIEECSPSIFIKLPFVIKTFVLSIFEWPLKTAFTVHSVTTEKEVPMIKSINARVMVLALCML